ncbi:MAG: T9SS type A sorting domain-containing protein [Saprospiraceae bacterium]|nr:T9SS type A sorting domain-containing protein [Saprospiraceae bacterium]
MIRNLSRLFILLIIAVWSRTASAQCEYTLQMFDSFGDGWNGGSLTVANGVNIYNFTLSNTLETDTVQFVVTNGLPLFISWTPGNYDDEVSFVLLDNAGNIIWTVENPNISTLYNGTAECVTCSNPLNFSVENVWDNRVRLRWTPDPASINPPVNWEVIYGVKGFKPEHGVGTSVIATQNKITITGLQKKSEYDAYLIQNCGNGDYADTLGPVSFKTYFTNDVGISAITSPKSSCQLGSNDTVRVQMTNFGSAPQSLIPFRYLVNGNDPGVSQPVDGFYTGVLGKDSTENLFFEVIYDFTEPGEYLITAFTEMNGDEDQSNDTFQIRIVNRLTVPYMQDFESWEGAWEGDGSWEFGTPQKAIIYGAASGNNAFVTRLEGEYGNAESSYLVSPCFDFSGLTEDPVFEFSLNTLTEDGYDGLVLEVSTDGGPWEKIGDLNSGLNWYNGNNIAQGSAWDGSTGGWVTARSTLPNTAGASEVKFRFFFKSDNSSTSEGVAIDDIHIYVPAQVDAAAMSIETTGEPFTCGSASDKVKFTFVNLGSVQQNEFVVHYKVNNEAVVSQNVTTPTPLDVDETYTVQFTTSFDSRDKLLNILCWVTIPNDSLHFNDTMQYSFNHAPAALPLQEDFEAAQALPAGWIASGGNIQSGHGNVTNVYAFNLYSGQTSFTLTSPRYGLLLAGDKIRFDYRMSSYTGGLPVVMAPGEKLEVLVSKNCGSSYTTIYTINTANHPLTVDLVTVVVDLPSDYVGEDIILRFKGTTTTFLSNDFWVDIDNINIISCNGDLGLYANVLAPTSGQSNGQAAINGFPNDNDAGYSFLWSNGATTSSVSNLSQSQYFVTVTNPDGCSQVLNVAVGAVGVNEPDGLLNLGLYPNPTNGQAVFQADFDQDVDAQLEVFSSLGQLLYATQYQNTQRISENLDLQSAASGVYFVRLIANGKSAIRRLVRE